MPLFLDTTGNAELTVAICARCSRKMPIGKLRADPNARGLLVCDEDRDQYDPWRLPARPPDKIAVRNVRPDTPLDPVPAYDPIVGPI